MKRYERGLSRKFLIERENHAPGGDHNSNWAISYGDMITLLLTFFILFFNVDRGKRDAVKLGQLVDETFNHDRGPAGEVTWGIRAPAEEASSTYAGVQENMERAFAAKTSVMGNRLIIEFPNISFFPTARYDMTPEGRAAMAKFAGLFQRFTGKMRLVVRGYTDNRPVISGRTFSDNLELSSLRAISALRVLQEYGIPFQLMRIGGYGETDKSPQTASLDKLAYDRKVVLVVEPLDETERGVASQDWSRVNDRTGEKK